MDGGPAVDLAAADGAGGSWGRNGRLVYTKAYNAGRWIVSEGGGDERMLTTPDTARGELGHWWPQILPDGDHVLFTAYRTPIERATIEVLSISSGKRKRSEEHTSELQSPCNLVCRLLLEKKKKKTITL